MVPGLWSVARARCRPCRPRRWRASSWPRAPPMRSARWLAFSSERIALHAAADDRVADRRERQRPVVQELAVEVDLDVGRAVLPEQVEVIDQVEDRREGARYDDV